MRNRILVRTVRAGFGALFGGLAYFGYAFWNYPTALLGPEAALWVLWMASLAFPVSLLGVLAADLVPDRRGRARLPILFAAGLVAAPASACTFLWYMGEFAPVVNWRSGLLLPVTASMAAFTLHAVGWPSPRRQDDRPLRS